MTAMVNPRVGRAIIRGSHASSLRHSDLRVHAMIRGSERPGGARTPPATAHTYVGGRA
jgi:hypothetical protein